MKLRLPNFGLTERMKDWVTGARDNDAVNMVLYDRTLLWLTFGLAIIGFVMVTSASMPIGQRLADDPFLFAKRDALYLGLAFGLSLVTLRIPMEVWQRYSNVMLLMSIVMLLIVLVVGSSVNGASRWIALGPLRIQPAELSKLSLFCYLASYLVRKVEEVRSNFWGFCKPMGVMVVLAVLLLAQPDLGTVVVLFITTLAMLFPGRRENVAVPGDHRLRRVRRGAADHRGTVPYAPRDLVLEPVGRPVRQRLPADPVADGVWPRRVLGAGARQLGAETRVFAGSAHRLHLLHFG